MTLSFAVSGHPAGPPLILGPALGATSEMWAPQLDGLGHGHKLLRYDHWGHGKSAPRHGPFTMDDLAAGVIELADEARVETFSYCGISLGGAVGLAVAALYPDRVARLVVLSTVAWMPPSKAWEVRASTAEQSGLSALAELAVGRWLTAEYATANPEVVTKLKSDFETIAPTAYAAYCRMAGDMDLRPMLPAIRAPTMVIAGEEDRATAPERQAELASRLPCGQMVSIPGVAHLLNVQRPAVVEAAILRHMGVPRYRHSPG